MKGVVGGAASSASKITDALDNFVRGAGHLDSESLVAGNMVKVYISIFSTSQSTNMLNSLNACVRGLGL